jgi:hypothetical protein
MRQGRLPFRFLRKYSFQLGFPVSGLFIAAPSVPGLLSLRQQPQHSTARLLSLFRCRGLIQRQWFERGQADFAQQSKVGNKSRGILQDLFEEIADFPP